MVQWMPSVAMLMSAGLTVTTRVCGVGSARPSASRTPSVTVYVPGFENTTAPGFCIDEAGAPPPKSQLNDSGRLPSGSVAVDVNDTLWPAEMATSPAGATMSPFGGWFGELTNRPAEAVAVAPSLSVT